MRIAASSEDAVRRRSSGIRLSSSSPSPRQTNKKNNPDENIAYTTEIGEHTPFPPQLVGMVMNYLEYNCAAFKCTTLIVCGRFCTMHTCLQCGEGAESGICWRCKQEEVELKRAAIEKERATRGLQLSVMNSGLLVLIPSLLTVATLAILGRGVQISPSSACAIAIVFSSLGLIGAGMQLKFVGNKDDDYTEHGACGSLAGLVLTCVQACFAGWWLALSVECETSPTLCTTGAASYLMVCGVTVIVISAIQLVMFGITFLGQRWNEDWTTTPVFQMLVFVCPVITFIVCLAVILGMARESPEAVRIMSLSDATKWGFVVYFIVAVVWVLSMCCAARKVAGPGSVVIILFPCIVCVAALWIVAVVICALYFGKAAPADRLLTGHVVLILCALFPSIWSLAAYIRVFDPDFED